MDLRYKNKLLYARARFGISLDVFNNPRHIKDAVTNFFPTAKPGRFETIPSFSDLDNDDLKYTVDFKQVYATILDKWLDANSSTILNNKYCQLDFI